MCAILESHVEISKLFSICKSVFKRWEWTSNGSQCSKGTRITIGWDSDMLDVMILNQSDQVIHAIITVKSDGKKRYCSFVYADNNDIIRRDLWQSIMYHKVVVKDNPWVIMGDFNSALNVEDKYMGTSTITTGMLDFNECVEQAEVFDINSSGFQYTWSQKPKTGIGI